jgi:Protein of unknown function (DUF3305)
MTRAAPPLMRIPVGVVVARRKAASQWIDFTWTPDAVLHGVPEAAPWTVLRQEGEETTMFYAGAAEIELYRTETTYYRDNLATGAPLLWVVMEPAEGWPPHRLVTVTADPAEGEGFSESAANLVETVPMPGTIAEIVAAFVAEHHVERQFFKRKRDRQDTESLARRGYGDHDE